VQGGWHAVAPCGRRRLSGALLTWARAWASMRRRRRKRQRSPAYSGRRRPRAAASHACGRGAAHHAGKGHRQAGAPPHGQASRLASAGPEGRGGAAGVRHKCKLCHRAQGRPTPFLKGEQLAGSSATCRPRIRHAGTNREHKAVAATVSSPRIPQTTQPQPFGTLILVTEPRGAPNHRPYMEPKRVMVAVDASLAPGGAAARALLYSCSHVFKEGDSLHLVTVMPPLNYSGGFSSPVSLPGAAGESVSAC